jgi:hypothetical protein
MAVNITTTSFFMMAAEFSTGFRFVRDWLQSKGVSNYYNFPFLGYFFENGVKNLSDVKTFLQMGHFRKDPHSPYKGNVCCPEGEGRKICFL